MDIESKKKCSELWKMASGDYIAPEDWTESAADELAKFFAANYDCSDAMSYVPKPSGSAPGYFWVVTYVYSVMKNRYQLDHGQTFTACRVVSLSYYRSTIAGQCLQ
jgi:hypothetical protein